MLIFSLILGGVAFYLIIYKLFVICFCYWRNLCTKHTWAKTLNEYLEALLLLSSLASPALIGITDISMEDWIIGHQQPLHSY